MVNRRGEVDSEECMKFVWPIWICMLTTQGGRRGAGSRKSEHSKNKSIISNRIPPYHCSQATSACKCLMWALILFRPVSYQMPNTDRMSDYSSRPHHVLIEFRPFSQERELSFFVDLIMNAEHYLELHQIINNFHADYGAEWNFVVGSCGL